MKVGLQISSFTWPGGDAAIGRDARRASCAPPTTPASTRSGSWTTSSRSGSVGRPEEPMLEGMTALGYMAAHTSRARLGLMVGGIHYRQPGLWLKAVTTLDVLSGGRAWFGIGAAWNVEESRAWASRCRHCAVRFEMLEDAPAGDRPGLARRARQRGGRSRAATCAWTACSTARRRSAAASADPGRRRRRAQDAAPRRALRRRLQRLRHGPDKLRHKFDVLRRHCDAVGRDYDEIERTNLTSVSITPDGSRGSLTPDALVERLGATTERRRPARDLQRPRRLGRLQARAHRREGHPAAARDGRAVARRVTRLHGYSRGVSGPHATMSGR